MSKRKYKNKIAEEKYIDKNGNSDWIERYKLRPPLFYTSGDGAFRSDHALGKKYKMARYGKTFRKDRISDGWKKNITNEEKKKIEEEHEFLIKNNKFKKYYTTFNKEGEKENINIDDNAVQWIKFYGLAEEPIINQGINCDIKKNICKNPCAICGTTNNIECDHKNDCWIYNEPRIGIKEEQKLSDFQALCKHCNDVKRQAKAKMIKENKRQPPPPNILELGIKFTNGDETFDINDPNWGIGCYWYDPIQFMKDIKNKYFSNSK